MQALTPRSLRPSSAPAPPLGVVGVTAPLGRDAALIARRLSAVGLRTYVSDDLMALCDALEAGHVDTLVLTTEGLTAPDAVRRLRRSLAAQPSWSDVPLLVLSAPGQEAADRRRLLSLLGASYNATILERPVPVSILASAVRLALMGRARQHEVHHMLDALEEARQTLEARVDERTRDVRRLASELTLAEHTERSRIAHLLHDDLQQRLHGLSVTLALTDQATASSDGDAAAELLAQAEETLHGAISLTRSLSHELAPPLLNGEGVTELLNWVAALARERYGLEVEVESSVETAPRKDVLVLLSQLMGELVLNVVKHAQTEKARVSARELQDPPRLRVRVEDAGAGFDTATPTAPSGALGLASVRERATLVGGNVAVASAPGAGTQVTIDLPLEGVDGRPPTSPE